MVFSIIRYTICALIDLVSDVLALVLSPVAACFVTVDANGREQISKGWRWITTHDAPIDAGRVDGYFNVPDTVMGRYWARVRWIWRNPAYQVSHWLGYDAAGTDPIQRVKEADSVGRLFVRTNYKGRVGFFYEKRTDHWHIQFGWKLYRRDPDGKRMIAFRLKPKR